MIKYLFYLTHYCARILIHEVKVMARAPLSKVGDEMIDKQFDLLQGKCIGTEPCTKIICYLKVGIYHGK